MKALIDRIVGEARDVLRREEDAVRADLRKARLAAEDDLERARATARELGAVQGSTVREMMQEDASEEIARLQQGAFDALAERFMRRVGLALQSLRENGQYETALVGWAAHAARLMDGPTEVTTARGDRRSVYDALLAAGAEDFQVLGSPRMQQGFVVRDLEGHTLFDTRPESLLREAREGCIERLRAFVGDLPALGTAEPLES